MGNSSFKCNAVICKVAKINGEYRVKKVGKYSTVRRAISIIGTDVLIAKNFGRDVRKIGKYYFGSYNGVIMMLYYYNINRGMNARAMQEAYDKGMAYFGNL